MATLSSTALILRNEVKRALASNPLLDTASSESSKQPGTLAQIADVSSTTLKDPDSVLSICGLACYLGGSVSSILGSMFGSKVANLDTTRYISYNCGGFTDKKVNMTAGITMGLVSGYTIAKSSMVLNPEQYMSKIIKAALVDSPTPEQLSTIQGDALSTQVVNHITIYFPNVLLDTAKMIPTLPQDVIADIYYQSGYGGVTVRKIHTVGRGINNTFNFLLDLVPVNLAYRAILFTLILTYVPSDIIESYHRSSSLAVKDILHQKNLLFVQFLRRMQVDLKIKSTQEPDNIELTQLLIRMNTIVDAYKDVEHITASSAAKLLYLLTLNHSKDKIGKALLSNSALFTYLYPEATDFADKKMREQMSRFNSNRINRYLGICEFTIFSVLSICTGILNRASMCAENSVIANHCVNRAIMCNKSGPSEDQLDSFLYALLSIFTTVPGYVLCTYIVIRSGVFRPLAQYFSNRKLQRRAKYMGISNPSNNSGLVLASAVHNMLAAGTFAVVVFTGDYPVITTLGQLGTGIVDCVKDTYILYINKVNNTAHIKSPVIKPVSIIAEDIEVTNLNPKKLSRFIKRHSKNNKTKSELISLKSTTYVQVESEPKTGVQESKL